MITAVIIEDEAMSRLSLRRKIIDYCNNITVVAEAENAGEGIVVINQFHPNVVFLDIEMPLMNGFDMLRRLTNRNFYLVFTTAYNKYTIQAIRFAAFDYLLKPVDIDELRAAVDKISRATVENRQEEQLELLHHNMVISKGLNKIAIPTAEGLLFFDIKDIVRLEASRNYSNLFFSNRNPLVSSRTLKEFEELLPRQLFFRSHHSHIINIGCIKKYSKADGGKIELLDGTEVELARRKRDDFLKLIRL